METFTLDRKRNVDGEFVIVCYVNGIRHPDGDYHTADLRDAMETLKLLRADSNNFGGVA